MKKKENKRKKRFYQRKGLWSFLGGSVLLGLIAIVLCDQLYLKKFRERAKGYDITKVDDLEIPSQIFDRKGELIGRSYDENRSLVTIEQVPPIFIDSLLAQEDQRFWEHDGVDWIGVIRAFYLNFRAGETTQGASTITMQLARNAFNLEEEKKKRKERGFERKLVESFVALRIEEHFVGKASGEERRQKKKKLLEMYINRVNFGKGYYGIRAASLGFFGKEPPELTMSESASIVCCVKNPEFFNPIRSPERNKKNRDMVFVRLRDEGVITPTEWQTLTAEPVVTNPKPLRRGTSYLYEKVVGLTREIVGDDAMSRGGFNIYTTVDRAIQNEAHKGLRSHLLTIEKHEDYQHPLFSAYDKSQGKAPSYLQGSVLVTDSETGAVLAHVGGRDFNHTQYDFIDSGRRPLGTSFLPIVYATAFEKGLNPATLLDDFPMDNREVGVGGIEGITGEYGEEIMNPIHKMGPITCRQALRDSKIAATVRLGQQIGVATVAAQAKKMDLPLESGEMLNRLLLGFEQASLWQICRAYTAFSKGGITPESPYYIDMIKDVDGKIIYRAPASQQKKRQYCSDASAYQIHSILADTTQRGNLASEAALLYEPELAVVKTGTTHNFSDGWSVGYNGKLTCGVWVGFIDGRKAVYEGAFGKDLALPVWASVMNAATANFPGQAPKRPITLTPVQLCESSGRKATRYCYESVFDPELGASLASSAYTEYLRVGKEEVGLCPVHGEGGVTPSQEFAPDTEEFRQRRLSVPPIIVEESSLIGKDPYGSVIVKAPDNEAAEETEEVAVPTEEVAAKGAENEKATAQAEMREPPVFRLSEGSRGEREATIRLRPPPRIELPKKD